MTLPGAADLLFDLGFHNRISTFSSRRPSSGGGSSRRGTFPRVGIYSRLGVARAICRLSSARPSAPPVPSPRSMLMPGHPATPFTFAEAPERIRRSRHARTTTFLYDTDVLGPATTLPLARYDCAVLSHSTWYFASPDRSTFADRVPGHPQVPGDLLDRLPFDKVLAPNPRNRLHDQHPAQQANL
jgi:hypothetical protein